jgi:hypothetical protein
MKFLCLAYGDGKDWQALTKDEQDACIAQDDVLRSRGDMIEVVGNVTTVRAWDGKPSTSDDPFATGAAPLVGFSLIEANDLEEAVALVAYTPCSRARGAVEVRPIEHLA